VRLLLGNSITCINVVVQLTIIYHIGEMALDEHVVLYFQTFLSCNRPCKPLVRLILGRIIFGLKRLCFSITVQVDYLFVHFDIILYFCKRRQLWGKRLGWIHVGSIPVSGPNWANLLGSVVEYGRMGLGDLIQFHLILLKWSRVSSVFNYSC